MCYFAQHLCSLSSAAQRSAAQRSAAQRALVARHVTSLDHDDGVLRAGGRRHDDELAPLLVLHSPRRLLVLLEPVAELRHLAVAPREERAVARERERCGGRFDARRNGAETKERKKETQVS
jgi:hypothetical protein